MAVSSAVTRLKRDELHRNASREERRAWLLHVAASAAQKAKNNHVPWTPVNTTAQNRSYRHRAADNPETLSIRKTTKPWRRLWVLSTTLSIRQHFTSMAHSLYVCGASASEARTAFLKGAAPGPESTPSLPLSTLIPRLEELHPLHSALKTSPHSLKHPEKGEWRRLLEMTSARGDGRANVGWLAS